MCRTTITRSLGPSRSVPQQDWPQFLQNEMNDDKDWPIDPYSQSYWLQSLHQGIRGRPQGSAKALVLSLKQFHAHYYRFCKKGPTKAMVDLQGLHSSYAFQHLNMLASVGLMSFCPWSFKFGGNAKTIVPHLWEVHYRLAISCNVCQSFASMSLQEVLEYQSKCREKSHKKSGLKKWEEAS